MGTVEIMVDKIETYSMEPAYFFLERTLTVLNLADQLELDLGV